MTITIDGHSGPISTLCFEVADDLTMPELAQVFRAIAFVMAYDIEDIDIAIPEERYVPRELDNEL